MYAPVLNNSQQYTVSGNTRNIQPSRIPHPGRIVVIGDVHGDLVRLISCLECMNIIQVNADLSTTWIAEPKNTVVVQLGDQIDGASRGGDPSWETHENKGRVDVDVIKFTDALDSIASTHGGSMISLLGNHEIMNVCEDYHCVSEHSMNSIGADMRRRMFTPGTGEIAGILSKRNVVAQVGPYLFCHGGLLPMHLNALMGDYDNANTIMRTWLRGDAHTLTTYEKDVLNTTVLSPDGILWTRLYMQLQEDGGAVEMLLDSVLSRTNSTCIFTGHNTVDNIYGIANNKLFFVDAGLSRCYPNETIQCVEIVTVYRDNMFEDVVKVVKMAKPARFGRRSSM